MFWLPWQVVAFLALLTLASVWVWLPDRWHAAVQSRRLGRVLPVAFVIATALVYGSMAAQAV